MTTAPECSCTCGSTSLHPLEGSGGHLVCLDCGARHRGQDLEPPPPPLPEREPTSLDDFAALMRHDVPHTGGGGSSGRARREEKPGVRRARKERRHEQEGGGAPVGRREKEVAQVERTEDRPLVAKLYAADWQAVEFLVETLSLPERPVTPSKVGRWGVLALLDRAAGQGVTLCEGCSFPMRPEELRCLACERRRT